MNTSLLSLTLKLWSFVYSVLLTVILALALCIIVRTAATATPDAIGVMAIWVGIMLYSFAMLSRYDNKLIGTLKNSLIICMHHLPQTIIMLIATVGLIYFSCIYFTAFIVTIPLILYVDSYIFSSIFKKLEKDMVKKDEPEVIENEESEDLIEDTTDNKEE
jgi:uncharacterized membrane protein YesL